MTDTETGAGTNAETDPSTTKYAYTTARMIFSDPQFKQWETRQDNLLIQNFAGLTLIATVADVSEIDAMFPYRYSDTDKIYLFRRTPNPNNSKEYILDLVWEGQHEKIRLGLENWDILACYEIQPPQKQQAAGYYIIWVKYPILLFDRTQFREYPNINGGSSLHYLKILVHRNNSLVGVLYKKNGMISGVKFNIQPWSKDGLLYHDKCNICHIIQSSNAIKATFYIWIIYNSAGNYFNIRSNHYRYGDSYLIFDAEQMTMTQEDNPDRKLELAAEHTTNNNLTEEIHNISRNDGKIYHPDANTFIIGLTIYNRRPLEIFDKLALECSSCPQIIRKTIHKFIRQKVIISCPAPIAKPDD